MGKCDDFKHWDGGTALHLAAEFNQLDIAKELINDGAGTSNNITAIACLCMKEWLSTLTF